jgi:hypothetical protein
VISGKGNSQGKNKHFASKYLQYVIKHPLFRTYKVVGILHVIPSSIQRVPELFPHMVIIKSKFRMGHQSIPPLYGIMTKVSVADYEFV